MGAHSTQGVGLLVFLLAFMLLGCAMFLGGDVLLLVLFLVGLVVSVGIFMKAKALEYSAK